MTAALILANGSGHTQWGVQPLGAAAVSPLQRLVLTFQQAGVERIVVAGGESFEELQRHLVHLGVVSLPVSGGRPADALGAGLRHLGGKARCVLVAPVEVCLFEPDTVARLLAQAGAGACAPVFEGRAGYPLLLDAACFARAETLAGAEELPAALEAGGIEVRRTEVKDRGVLRNLRRQEAAGECAGPGPVRPVVKVCLAAGKPFYGPGPHLLLCLIDETKMLRQACELMGISYSKGLRMVREMEQQSGDKLVQRHRGGSRRGRSELTPRGRRLLAQYRLFQQRSSASVQALYEEIFPGGF